MTDDVQKDVQIHIHEHVGPLRERVSRLEGRMDVGERELTMLRQGLEQLRDRIDNTKEAVLSAFSAHEQLELAKHDQIDQRMAQAAVLQAELAEQVRSTKNWIRAIGIGAMAVVSGLMLLERLGVIHR